MLHKITAPEGPDTLLWDTSILSSMAEVRSHCLNLPWVLLVIGRGCGDNRGNMWGVLLSPRTCLLSVSYLSVLKMNIGRVGRAWSAMGKQHCLSDLGCAPGSPRDDAAFVGRQHLFRDTAAARTAGILSCCLMATPSSCLVSFPCSQTWELVGL